MGWPACGCALAGRSGRERTEQQSCVCVCGWVGVLAWDGTEAAVVARQARRARARAWRGSVARGERKEEAGRTRTAGHGQPYIAKSPLALIAAPSGGGRKAGVGGRDGRWSCSIR
jgi:hypothetical protein